MQLAADPIYVVITGEVYELRPTLRAALRITRKHGGFAEVYRSVAGDHLSVICDVLREATDSYVAANDYQQQIDAEIVALRDQLTPIKTKLLDYIVRLAGLEDATDERDEGVGETVPFAEYYAKLFEIGTGWLGWSPTDTWEASPVEILAAQHGRTGMISAVLKSVFGSSDDDTEASVTAVPTRLTSEGLDPAFDRAGLAALRAKYGKAA